jgi:pre-mRNA-splicing helicase BRR2
MELSQMAVQALWPCDSPLLQVPHFGEDALARGAARGVPHFDVFDLLGLDDAARDDVLRLPPHKLSAVAAFCNAYPTVELAWELADGAAEGVAAGDSVTVLVTLAREANEGEDDSALGAVHAARFPKPKKEGWWLVVGDAEANALLTIKCVALQRHATVKLAFAAPDAVGEHHLVLLLMSDACRGCDKEYEFTLVVDEAGPNVCYNYRSYS